MNLQQWALLIVPNGALLVILGVIVAAFRQTRREREAVARQQAHDFEQHRRML